MVGSMELHSPHRMMNPKKRGDGIFAEKSRYANTCTLYHVRGMYSTFLPIGMAPFVLNPVQIFRQKFIFKIVLYIFNNFFVFCTCIFIINAKPYQAVLRQCTFPTFCHFLLALVVNFFCIFNLKLFIIVIFSHNKCAFSVLFSTWLSCYVLSWNFTYVIIIFCFSLLLALFG